MNRTLSWTKCIALPLKLVDYLKIKGVQLDNMRFRFYSEQIHYYRDKQLNLLVVKYQW